MDDIKNALIFTKENELKISMAGVKHSMVDPPAIRTVLPDASGIGHDLTRIALDPKHPRQLATEADLLALRPELHHIE